MTKFELNDSKKGWWTLFINLTKNSEIRKTEILNTII